MWGKSTVNETDKSSAYISVGYIGLIEDKANGNRYFLCEAGSAPLHDRGDFDLTLGDRLSCIRSRGTCNLFDDEWDVKSAFNRKYAEGFSLVKIMKVQYSEMMCILDD